MVDREDIIKMANDAGIKGPAPARQGFKMYASPQRLMAFAALVAAAEREACAKVCEERQEVFQKYYTKGLAAMCAEAIRARSEQ
jgi:hypothetical protein